jgi:hypothetical protein
MAEHLRARGWRGATEGLTSTVAKLKVDGYLAAAGSIVRGKKRPSPLYRFVEARRPELEAAISRNAAHHIDAGNEFILVPANNLATAAAPLRAAGPEVLWAIRTGDSSVGLVVVVSHTATPAVRDALVTALRPAGAWRISGIDVLDRVALDRYCAQLATNAIAALPQTI